MEFAKAQIQVEALVLAQGTLKEVSAFLEASELSDEEQATLWLYGWALLPIAHQRPEALAKLGQMIHPS